MPLDLEPLLARAFLVADATDANEALAEARDLFGEGGGRSFSYELVVPHDAGVPWLEGVLVKQLVYHCESTRSPLPDCGGVFASLFVAGRLHCVAASEVMGFAQQVLGVDAKELVRRFGTGELREPIRGPAGLLPPGGDGA